MYREIRWRLWEAEGDRVEALGDREIGWRLMERVEAEGEGGG